MSDFTPIETQEQFDEMFGGRTDEEDTIIQKAETEENLLKTGETIVLSNSAYFVTIYKGWVTDLSKIPNESFDWVSYGEEPEYEEKSLSLNDIYKQAIDRGIINPRDILTVVVDMPMKGYIYEWGNYGAGKWTLLGKTKGYA